jgi:hypothetical protein
MSLGKLTYLWEVEEEGVRGESAAREEHVCHPALFIVAGDIFVREDMHKQLHIIVKVM